MPLSFSLYNSTAIDIVIDDIPVTATVLAHQNAALDPSTTLNDVQNSLLIRQYDLNGQVAVTLNGRGIKLSKLGLAVGVPASGDGAPATAITYDDSLTPAFGAVTVQGALDVIKTDLSQLPIVLWENGTLWSAVVTRLANVSYKAILYIEAKPLFAIVPYQLIDSSIDLKSIFCIGIPNNGAPVIVHFADGVTAGSTLTSKNVDWRSESTTPVFSDGVGIFAILDNSNLSTLVATPFIDCPAAASFFYLFNKSSIGASSVSLEDFATPEIFVSELSSLAAGAFSMVSGTATVSQSRDDSSTVDPAAYGAGITVTDTLSSKAANDFYDDALVPPTLGAGTTQAAIDRLKTGSGSGIVTWSTGMTWSTDIYPKIFSGNAKVVFIDDAAGRTMDAGAYVLDGVKFYSENILITPLTLADGVVITGSVELENILLDAECTTTTPFSLASGQSSITLTGGCTASFAPGTPTVPLISVTGTGSFLLATSGLGNIIGLTTGVLPLISVGAGAAFQFSDAGSNYSLLGLVFDGAGIVSIARVSSTQVDPLATSLVTGTIFYTGLDTRHVPGSGGTLLTNSGGTITAFTIAYSNQVFSTTLTAAETIVFNGHQAGNRFRLVLVQDSTGGWTVTWPADVKWPSGVAPVLTLLASKLDIFEFVDDGVFWYGFIIGQNYDVPTLGTGFNVP